MDRLTPSTSNAATPPPVNLDPPPRNAPDSHESGVGQDPVAAPTQAENVPRVEIDKGAADRADARGEGFATEEQAP